MNLRLVMDNHHFQPVGIDAVPLINLHFFIELQPYACP